jgi:hypothetical protein
MPAERSVGKKGASLLLQEIAVAALGRKVLIALFSRHVTLAH